MKKLVLACFAIALLSACASDVTKFDNNLYPKYIVDKQLESVEKINSFRFSGWKVLNEQYLILKVSQNRRFLLELQNKCFELKFAHRILINKGSSSVLHSKFDSVSIPGELHQKCFIRTIYKVDKEQYDELVHLNAS